MITIHQTVIDSWQIPAGPRYFEELIDRLEDHLDSRLTALTVYPDGHPQGVGAYVWTEEKE